MNAIVDPIYEPIDQTVAAPIHTIVIECMIVFPNGTGSYRIRADGLIIGVWTKSWIGHIVSDLRTGRTWTCGTTGIEDILREFFTLNQIDYDAIHGSVKWP